MKFFLILFVTFLVSGASYPSAFLSESKTRVDFTLTSQPLTFEKEEREILKLINNYRADNDLPELEWNDELANLARQYSEKMARERFFSHFDSKGNSIAQRVKTQRIRGWRKLGENLFTCQGYPKFTRLAFNSWLKSSSHRRNMLEEQFNQTGIGVAKSDRGVIYITQIFMQR